MQSWVKHYCCRVNEDVSLSPLWTCVAPVCQETKTNKMETAVAHLTEDFIFYLTKTVSETSGIQHCCDEA